MRRAVFLLLLALAECAGGRLAPARPDPAIASVIAMAADQVRPCYRAPGPARDARGIVTVLRVDYAPDGSLADLPSVVEQRGLTPANAFVAPALAQAAALAVVRCAPVRLPAALYRGGWDSLQLTFSPKAVA